MHAQIGDQIVLAGEQVDRPTRSGEVVEVRGRDGAPPYVVRWSDGHTGLLYPGPGSVLRVQTSGEGAAVHEEQAAASARTGNGPVREWQVRISIYEDESDTTANAVLVAGSTEQRASGFSHRSTADPQAPLIGEEVAVARALRHLAEQLLDTAARDIEVSTGEGDVYIRPR